MTGEMCKTIDSPIRTHVVVVLIGTLNVLVVLVV